MLLLSGLLSLISSCSSLPDEFICRSRTVNSGFCTKTISNTDQIVDDEHPLLLNGTKKTWLDIKIEAVMVPAESWIKIKEYFIKQCKKNNNCNQDIDSWDRKLNSIGN